MCTRCGRHPQSKIYAAHAHHFTEEQRGWCAGCRSNEAKTLERKLLRLAVPAREPGTRKCANPECVVTFNASSVKAFCIKCTVRGYASAAQDGTWAEWAARRFR